MRALRYILTILSAASLLFRALGMVGAPHTPNLPAPLCLEQGSGVGWWIYTMSPAPSTQLSSLSVELPPPPFLHALCEEGE